MSESPIAISNLNDFIFCPVSIYFHNLDYETETLTYQDTYQINGTAVHKTVDSSTYSDKTTILQGIPVYSEKYNLFGKIDLYDSKTGVLTERKKKVKVIYDGYVFQVFSQYFGLTEMGYNVKTLRIHSVDDNKIYPIKLPQENPMLFDKFKNLIEKINSFDFNNFKQTNVEKCKHCIYENLCSFSGLKE